MTNDEGSIANFRIDVLAEVTEITDARKTCAVKFKIKLDSGGESDIITVPLTGPKGLENLNWYDLHPHIRIFGRLRAVRQLLVNEIRSKLPFAKKETVYRISRLGANIIGDEVVYNTGGDIIRAPLDRPHIPDIIAEPSRYRLDIDPNLTEADAVAEMMNIVRLSPNAGRVIFAHSLLYIMRRAYEAAWKSPCCILVLYGYTGTKKTTISAFMTQLHNRGQGIEDPPRLNASIPAAEAMLYEKSDCVIVLDDLFPAQFRDVKNKQEKTFQEITRIIADGVGRARIKGSQIVVRVPTCGVIFTCEHLFGTGSDAARLLPIRFTTPIDDVKLGECQAKPLVVSTFFNYFIGWYIENFAKIQGLLKKWWEIYQKTEFGVHGRLRETHFFLSAAYKIFLRYCVEKNFISDEDEQQHHRAFEDLLTGLVRMQQKRIEENENKAQAKIDTFKFIRTLVKGNSLRLTKSRKRFLSAPEEYDGLLHDRLLCFRSERLIQLFQKSGYINNLIDVRKRLIANEALYLDSEGKNKKIGNIRVYGIYLNKLG